MQNMASSYPRYSSSFKCLCNASDEDALSLTSLQLLHLILLRNLNLNPEARFTKDYYVSSKDRWAWLAVGYVQAQADTQLSKRF